MAETVNAEGHNRTELNQLALDANLTDAERYSNKQVVADAINRVNAGENAETVNAELAPAAASSDENDTDATSASETDSQAPAKPRKQIHEVNGGHPTKFDETGNPVYDPAQV